MRIVSKDEMRKLETEVYEKFFFNESLIVENVGKEGAKYIFETVLEESTYIECLFLIGKGNNGSDGLAIARHLVNKGVEVRAFILMPLEELKEESKNQLRMAQNFGVKINFIKSVNTISEYFERAGSQFIVVDGLFGTGVRLPISQYFYDLIHYVNNNSPFIVSIDVPSGIDGDNGHHHGVAINADVTLAIGLPKLGYFVSEGAKHIGEIKVIDAGFPKVLLNKGNKSLLTMEGLIDIASKKRNKFADKKTFGHTVIIGGSHGLTGALVMASQAALRVGAGLVTAATWEDQYHEFIARLEPEIMTGYLPNNVEEWPRLIKDLDKYDSIVIGPGLAKSTNCRKLVLEILENYDGPVVIDADAINVLNVNQDTKIFTGRNAPTILTPHFGEFARFTNQNYEDVLSNPVGSLQNLIEKINCTVILKGPCTYLGFPNGKILFNFFPNDGMASAGVGDVLAGIMGGLLGQDKVDSREQSLFNRYENLNKTVALAVLIHSVAGQIAAKNKGVRPMSATTIIDSFTEAFKLLEERIEKALN